MQMHSSAEIDLFNFHKTRTPLHFESHDARGFIVFADSCYYFSPFNRNSYFCSFILMSESEKRKHMPMRCFTLPSYSTILDPRDPSRS